MGASIGDAFTGRARYRDVLQLLCTLLAFHVCVFPDTLRPLIPTTLSWLLVNLQTYRCHFRCLSISSPLAALLTVRGRPDHSAISWSIHHTGCLMHWHRCAKYQKYLSRVLCLKRGKMAIRFFSQQRFYVSLPLYFLFSFIIISNGGSFHLL